jgi:hypothetical protein
MIAKLHSRLLNDALIHNRKFNLGKESLSILALNKNMPW